MDDSQVAKRIGELYNELKEEEQFWNEITKRVNEEFGTSLSRDAVRGRGRRWDRSGEKSKLVTKNKEQELKIDDEESVIEDTPLSEDETLDDFIARKRIDLSKFAIVEATLNEYAGNEQIKVRVRPKMPDVFNEKEFLDKIASVVSRHSRESVVETITPYGKIVEESKNLFVPCLFDAHIESPSFSGDYFVWLNDLMKMGVQGGYNPDTILLIIGNDFGHFDDQNYQTTSGTLVGGTRTYLDSVDERCSIMLKAIDLMTLYSENVNIAFVPGNHDRLSTYWLKKVAESFYKEDGAVNIVGCQNPRTYFLYGETLLGMTHGSDEKKFDLASLMAVESPIEWSKSKKRMWLTGHLHQQNRAYNMLSEKFGVISRIFPSLVDPDDWHILKGYIGNDRAAELLVFDDKGKVAEFHLSVR